MKKRTKSKRKLPRLYVFRSNKHIYAQVIDDIKNITITTSSSTCRSLKAEINTYATCKTAQIVGEDIGHKLRNQGITKIVFDRGSKMYHGKIKALAEAIRNTGIEF
uniref:Large ribosomal subunit protein uL18c n=1 Tax=Synarthrophyton chejuense TaxID=2485825 RepID=A0A3G3MFW4_9FLOR|nr:ribosomal protein L18 [Synarthrophyton chejuense]AYR05719.1 ribosomal protein L18 [Synarthrophyton chejuense]